MFIILIGPVMTIEVDSNYCDMNIFAFLLHNIPGQLYSTMTWSNEGFISR